MNNSRECSAEMGRYMMRHAIVNQAFGRFVVDSDALRLQQSRPAKAADEEASTLSNVEACLGWQLLLVCIWSQMYIFSFLVETRRNQVLIVAAWVTSALTVGCGRWVTRCSTHRLQLISPTYALLCTLLCCAVFAVASIPTVERKGDAVSWHTLLGTALSVALACVSVRATSVIQAYCDALDPDAPSTKHREEKPRGSSPGMRRTGTPLRKAGRRARKAKAP